MDEATFQKFLSQVSGWVHDININLFGEPTIHPLLPAWIKQLAQHDIHVTIVTNGNGVSQELIDVLCQDQTGHIAFSIETDEFNNNRVGSNKEKILKTIKKINKQRGNSRRPIISVQSLLFSEINHKARKLHQSYLKTIGVDYITWTPITNWAGNLQQNTPSIDYNTIKRNCEYPWLTLAVDWDGSVTSCCEDFLLFNSLGNINNTNIRSLWNSPKIKRQRKALRNKELSEFPACQKCSLLYPSHSTLQISMFKQNSLIFIHKLLSYFRN